METQNLDNAMQSSGPHSASTEQQLLSPAQENTLVQWLCYLGILGRSACPVCKQGIRTRAQTLHPKNKMPSHNWVQLFLNQHPDITLSLATGLDPKQASGGLAAGRGEGSRKDGQGTES